MSSVAVFSRVAALSSWLLVAVAERPAQERQTVEYKPSDSFQTAAPMFALWYTATAWQKGDLKARHLSMSWDFPETLTTNQYASVEASSPLCRQGDWNTMLRFASALFHDFVGDDLWGKEVNEGMRKCIPVQEAVRESYRRAAVEPPDELNRWMKPLTTSETYSKTVLFRDLLLPGSHDAGCYGEPSHAPTNKAHFICQSKNITDQLNSGARIFDLRFSEQQTDGRLANVANQVISAISPRSRQKSLVPAAKEDIRARFVIGHDAFHLGSLQVVGLFDGWNIIRDQLKEWCRASFGEVLVLRFKPNRKPNNSKWPDFLKIAAEDLRESAHIVPNEGTSGTLGHKLLSDLIDPETTKCSMILTIYNGKDKDPQDLELLQKVGPKTFHKYNSLYVGHYGQSADGETVRKKERNSFDEYAEKYGLTGSA